MHWNNMVGSGNHRVRSKRLFWYFYKKKNFNPYQIKRSNMSIEVNNSNLPGKKKNILAELQQNITNFFLLIFSVKKYLFLLFAHKISVHQKKSKQ